MGMRRASLLAGGVAAALVGSLVSALAVSASAQADPPPQLSGTITDLATGDPIAGACVDVFSVAGQRYAHTCTGTDGRYDVIALVTSAGNYKIKVTAPGHVEQWAPDEPTFRNALPIRLQPASPVVQDLALRTTAGAVAGRITDPEGQVPSR